MKHILPADIKTLLEQQSNLGFEHVREAAEFVLSNADWYVLLKGVKYEERERDVINAWRDEMVTNEKVRCIMKPIPQCASINPHESTAFSGKVSKQGFED